MMSPALKSSEERPWSWMTSRSSVKGTECAVMASTTRPFLWAHLYQSTSMARPAMHFLAISVVHSSSSHQFCSSFFLDLSGRDLTLDSIGN